MSETFTGADIATAAAASTTSAEPTTTAPDATAAASPDTTPAASASAPTTAAPASVDDDSPDSILTGPIPPERHKRILENARKKEAARLQSEFEQKYGFAPNADPEELKAALDWNRRANADPVGFVTNLWEQVQANPQLGPQLRSQAARILGQRQTPPAETDPMPAADLVTVDDQGRPTGKAYSEQQQLKYGDWLKRQIQQETQKTLAPLQAAHNQTLQEREFQAVTQRADQFAATTMDAVGKLPGFKEHASTIMERYAALPTVRDPQTGWMVPDPNDPRTEDRKLLDIYHEVVLPTFQQTAQKAAVHDLQQKARATTLNPAGGGTAEPFDHKKATWAESIAYEYNKRMAK
jgi:hypothetical protein